jgi:hypothetical protein
MALPLATDIRIEHGDDTVRLVPSLRAAYLLNSAYGVGRLEKAVREFNTSIIFDILAHAGNGVEALTLLRRKIADTGLGPALTDISRPLNQFLCACFAIDKDPAVDHPAVARAKAGEPFDLGKTISDLFEIATGWLGWTPEQAWQATPAEIIAAHRGLIAKLKAIHGSGEEQQESTYDPREEVSEDQMRAGIAALKAEAQRGRQ